MTRPWVPLVSILRPGMARTYAVMVLRCREHQSCTFQKRRMRHCIVVMNLAIERDAVVEGPWFLAVGFNADLPSVGVLD